MAKIQKELDSGGLFGKNCKWITAAIAAGACMGTGAFLFASKFSDYSTPGLSIMDPGAFIMCLFIRVYQECRFKLRTGSWFKPKGSRVIGPDGKILWKTLIPVIMNIVTNGGYLCLMAQGWKFAKAAGLNQGVISTLLSLASLFNIIIFYLKFGEKISPLHFIGIFLMIACIICISVAATTDGEEDEDFDPDDTFGLSSTVSGILAILCGLMSALLMSTKHLFIRLYKSNYSGVDQGIDTSMIEFGLYMLLFIPLLNNPEVNLTYTDMLIGGIAGCLVALGRILISVAVSIGLAGPAQSLMSTHALHQSFWSAIVAG